MGSTKVLEPSAAKSAKKSSKKKRREPEVNTTFAETLTNDKEVIDVVDVNENEPTMAEKLASFDFANNETAKVEQKQESPPVQPPSADSVHILLKQAIHADDRALLLDCLYNQDQKSRGAVLACALPWLRSLLLQHASKIMSQESSLVALNSLYQLIESRVSTFGAAVQLSSCLDSLYAGATGDVTDEDEPAAPVIYDDDESDDDNDAMETDEEDAEEVEGSSNVSDAEGSMQMSD